MGLYFGGSSPSDNRLILLTSIIQGRGNGSTLTAAVTPPASSLPVMLSAQARSPPLSSLTTAHCLGIEPHWCQAAAPHLPLPAPPSPCSYFPFLFSLKLALPFTLFSLDYLFSPFVPLPVFLFLSVHLFLYSFCYLFTWVFFCNLFIFFHLSLHFFLSSFLCFFVLPVSPPVASF